MKSEMVPTSHDSETVRVDPGSVILIGIWPIHILLLAPPVMCQLDPVYPFSYHMQVYLYFRSNLLTMSNLSNNILATSPRFYYGNFQAVIKTLFFLVEKKKLLLWLNGFTVPQ